ncbi:ComF family protein [Candidatus Acetothermia bacterium]|nr:ComF family protein [Candidatus Acetothermia bacterium]MCI2432210.1 ComF family protein [Candidatus Acetothermia bacterium]MCI2436113.1 ComF family protein [Candidatus Acetothermia bacterium]
MKILDALISCGPYEGALEESVKALKYEFREELAQPLARELAVAFVKLPLRPDVLTWVPMHAKDRRWRGFNHSQLLAEELSRIVRVPAKELLRKCKETGYQTNLNPIARALNVRDCFELPPNATVAGLKIAVIDDVCCSGATLWEAARVLKKAGARRVYGLVCAESVHRPEIVEAIRQRWPDFGW